MSSITQAGAIPQLLRAVMTRAVLLLLTATSLVASAEDLELHDAIRTVVGLTNQVIRLDGKAELRVTGSGDPIPGCTVHLDSPDAWLLMSSIAPSQVASTLLSRVRVNGAAANLDANVRVVQFAQGAVVIPHGAGFTPLEVFDGRFFTGSSKRLGSYVKYDDTLLGSMAGAIGSFKLKRGYVATVAQQENGSGVSRCYVAQDGDLEVGLLPAALENNIHLVRVFPWRWVSKKGVAGNIESGLDVDWVYNWNLDRNSPLDWEYVPIRQTRWWPNLDQDWRSRGATHVLGYNEPDHADQANMTVTEAISSWPDVLAPGLRVGAPAVSDGGLSWLYDFMSQADAAGLRVDFVPVHYYRCYGNAADPNGAATQFYNFLKGIYDTVKRPLWITEWNNGANWTSCADPTFAQQQATVAAILDMLDSTPFVERYAIYNWVEDVRRVKWDDGSLTAAGVTYRDQAAPLAYRQEMADAGSGSSARYSFDGHTHDEWGNGQDAMRIGAPVFTAGKYGQAISLNGSTDYLQLSARLADSTDWSFAGWILWNGGGNWQRIFDFGDDANHYLFLTPKSSANTLRFAITSGSGEQQLNTTALPVGVWTHVAVTISGSTGKLFVNGLPVATNTAMTINPVDVGTKFNYLGKSRFAADPLFGGRLDDVRFVSSALSDAQVAAIVSTPPPQFWSTTLVKPPAPVGQLYTASIASDAAGIGPLTFSKMDGPTWLTVSANGSLTGTPATPNGGINTFLVRVTDTNGSLHTATLSIVVPTLTVAISSGTDDAEQAASGAVALGSTDLELVNDDATGAGNQLIGLRFAGVSIPRGAIVTNATIQFTADESQSEATTLSIVGEASDDAATFSTAANNISSRPVTSVSVPWQPAAWSSGQAAASQRTPNLAGLVQEIVSRPGWEPGNAISFIISGTGHRTADAFDKSNGVPARLLLEFTAPTPLLTAQATVSSSANDAEQAASGAVTLNSTDLELVNDGAAGDQTVGLRFENVRLTGTSIVASASIQFTADETQTEPTALNIRAQASDNAPLFNTSANNLSARPVTTAMVPWDPAAWENIGERSDAQRTPDVSKLVQEIISRPGWTSGNAMAFLISGSGHRTAEAADKAGSLPAALTVNYWSELPIGTYDRWAASQPNVTAPDADPDGDGYSNLMEYALGLDPSVPTPLSLPLLINGASLQLTYSRPVDVTDVTYRVEWSDALTGPWSAAGVTQQIVSDDGQTRVIRATMAKGAANQRFVRLKVSR